MNTRFRNTAVALIALSIAACAGTRVATDHDPSARFDTLHTYAWLAPADVEIDDPLLDSQLLTQKVRHSVDAVLTQRGYSAAADPASADFVVTYHTASKERLRDRGGFSIGLGIGRSWHHGHHSMFLGDRYFPQIEGYQEGTLIIDVLAGDGGNLLWRGWIRNTVDPRNYTAEAVDEAVREILAQFPPGYTPPE